MVCAPCRHQNAGHSQRDGAQHNPAEAGFGYQTLEHVLALPKPPGDLSWPWPSVPESCGFRGAVTQVQGTQQSHGAGTFQPPPTASLAARFFHSQLPHVKLQEQKSLPGDYFGLFSAVFVWPTMCPLGRGGFCLSTAGHGRIISQARSPSALLPNIASPALHH